jgi:catechol 2,3-dioxygenase-like lactoylglutathione lyase family enzyme
MVARDAHDVTIRRAVPNVVSDDLEATQAFYEGFLGFEVAMDEEGFLMFASPSSRTAQVTAAARSGPGQDRGIRHVHMSVEVADVDAAYASAERLGLDVIYPLTDEPWGIRRFFVRDPDGTVVNVNSHVAGPSEP